MRPHKLYLKSTDKENNDTLLWITRYLYSTGVNIRPRNIQERLFPAKILETPAIELTNGGPVICGLDDVIEHYSRELQIKELKEKAVEFKKNNPDFRITP